MCDPCNSFLAKVRESQGTRVPKSQGKSGSIVKKITVKTLLVDTKIMESEKTALAKYHFLTVRLSKFLYFLAVSSSGAF